jgi:formylmethanofuran dehydrogenase subunit E-like metal-binding protein
MKGKTIVALLALAMLVSSSLLGCSSPAPTVQGEASIVNDYPGLKPLVDFVGEENLSVLNLVGFRAADRAMKDLSLNRGDSNILALTDAGYIAQIGEYTTEKALDGAIMTSGASRGKGNLVNVHKPYNSPLWFAFFDKKSKDCVYLEAKSDVLKTYLSREKTERDATLRDFVMLKDKEIFTRIAKENIDVDRLLNNPESWQKKMVAKVFGGNEFSLITLCNLWAIGLPNDFLKVAELHDHICPGLTSGYMIAEYIKKNFPSSNPRNEYIVIAIPPWCKDDALIQIFETNVGHKAMYVKHLTKEQKTALSGEAKKVANIFINKKTNKGVVVGFDWAKVYEVAEMPDEAIAKFRDFTTYWWWWGRLKEDIALMDYLDKPEEFVSTIKEFDTTPEQIEKLKAAGVNPLVELGIMPKP